MKKLITKAILVVVIALGASNYMLYIMTGKTPFDSNDMKIPDLSLSSPKLDKINPLSGSSTVYKWVDENGVTQYSSEPPPENVQRKVLEIDPNVNVVQGLRIEEEEPQEIAQTQNNVIPQGQVYNPQAIKKLMDDAKNVQKKLNERYKEQEKALQDF